MKKVYFLPNGGKLKLSEKVVEQLLEFVQDKPNKKEAGGVMLGRLIKDSSDLVIDKITVPQSNDRRNRYRFFRSRKKHQDLISESWEKSKGTCNYLGEWHTHPEEFPQPSTIDIVAWVKKLRQDQFYTDTLYFLIVGTREIAIWEGYKNSSKIFKLYGETEEQKREKT